MYVLCMEGVWKVCGRCEWRCVLYVLCMEGVWRDTLNKANLVLPLKVVVNGHMDHGQNEEENSKDVVAKAVQVMLLRHKHRNKQVG